MIFLGTEKIKRPNVNKNKALRMTPNISWGRIISNIKKALTTAPAPTGRK